MGLEFEVTSPTGQKLQAWLDDSATPGHAQDWKKLRLLQSAPADTEWTQVPLRLALTSRISKLWFSSHPYWPPTWITQIGIQDDNFWFEYKDEPSDWRTTFKPSLWRAEYVPTSRHWKIKRLQSLDSEHERSYSEGAP
ncbi:MAG: hypothetical protein V4641_06645 [Pseudomonadota bacterium]